MTRIDRRTAMAGIGAGMLAACSPAYQSAESTKRPAEGGIGGTGIIGTLTDFGSLIINGIRVRTGPDTAYSDSFGTIVPRRIGIGHTLTIEARPRPDGLHAVRIQQVHPVIGIVDRVGPVSATIAGITVFAEPALLATLPAGSHVAVSGIWRGTDVVASRLDVAEPGTTTVLAGEIARSASGAPTLGGIRLQPAPGVTLPEEGTFATLTGSAQGGTLSVSGLTVGRFTGAIGAPAALSVEGYLEPIERAPFYAISGLGHSFDANAKLAAVQSRRAVFSGAYDGAFRVDNASILPEGTSERKQVIRSLLDNPGTVPGIATR